MYITVNVINIQILIIFEKILFRVLKLSSLTCWYNLDKLIWKRSGGKPLSMRCQAPQRNSSVNI